MILTAIIITILTGLIEEQTDTDEISLTAAVFDQLPAGAGSIRTNSTNRSASNTTHSSPSPAPSPSMNVNTTGTVAPLQVVLDGARASPPSKPRDDVGGSAGTQASPTSQPARMFERIPTTCTFEAFDAFTGGRCRGIAQPDRGAAPPFDTKRLWFQTAPKEGIGAQLIDYRAAADVASRSGLVVHWPSRIAGEVRAGRSGDDAIDFLGLNAAVDHPPLSSIIDVSSWELQRVVTESAAASSSVELNYGICMQPNCGVFGVRERMQKQLSFLSLACTRQFFLEKLMARHSGRWPQVKRDAAVVVVALHHRRGEFTGQANWRLISDALASNIVNLIIAAIRRTLGEAKVCVDVHFEETDVYHLKDWDKTPSKLRFDTRCVNYVGGNNETLTGFLKAMFNADVIVGGGSSLYWAAMQYSRAIGVVYAPAGCPYEICQNLLPNVMPLQHTLEIDPLGTANHDNSSADLFNSTYFDGLLRCRQAALEGGAG